MADIKLTEAEREALLIAGGTTDLCGCELCMDTIAAVEKIVAARVEAARIQELREAADDMEQFEPFPGEEPDWLRGRADRIEDIS